MPSVLGAGALGGEGGANTTIKPAPARQPLGKKKVRRTAEQRRQSRRARETFSFFQKQEEREQKKSNSKLALDLP